MRHTGAPYGSIPNSRILRGPCVSPSLELRESGKLKDQEGEGCHGLKRQSSRSSGAHSKGSRDCINRRGCGASQNGSATHSKRKTSSGKHDQHRGQYSQMKLLAYELQATGAQEATRKPILAEAKTLKLFSCSSVRFTTRVLDWETRVENAAG